MRPPFPGMDPWIEHPGLWPDVHNRLIASIADALVPLVDPRYYVGVESRMVLYPGTSTRPDIAVSRGEPDAPPARFGAGAERGAPGVATLVVDLPLDEGFEVNQTYLEVREAESRALVTAIEVLSPANKDKGRGREQYLAKRFEVLHSATSLVEIDLLRGGEPMPLARPVAASAYRYLISRGADRPRARYVAIGLRVPLPAVAIPLLPGDAEVTLDLNGVLHDLIDRARYFRRVDYARPPVPTLDDDDDAWAHAIIDRAG